MFSYGEFLSEYNIPVSPKDVAVVFDSIPAGLRFLISTADTSHVQYPLSYLLKTQTISLVLKLKLSILEK